MQGGCESPLLGNHFSALLQRPLFRHYYQNTNVVIFVLDSNDRDRLPECKDEIWRMLAEQELKSAPLLVMANKQDLPNAMSVEEITDQLELNKVRDREWCKLYRPAHIQWSF